MRGTKGMEEKRFMCTPPCPSTRKTMRNYVLFRRFPQVTTFSEYFWQNATRFLHACLTSSEADIFPTASPLPQIPRSILSLSLLKRIRRDKYGQLWGRQRSHVFEPTTAGMKNCAMKKENVRTYFFSPMTWMKPISILSLTSLGNMTVKSGNAF